MMIADVRRAVAKHYGLPDAVLRGRSKSREVVRPRQVAMYLASNLCGRGPSVLANIFKRDRKTIYHACKVIERERHIHAADIFAIIGSLPE